MYRVSSPEHGALILEAKDSFEIAAKQATGAARSQTAPRQ
jgi:hypothetical protein